MTAILSERELEKLLSLAAENKEMREALGITDQNEDAVAFVKAMVAEYPDPEAHALEVTNARREALEQAAKECDRAAKLHAQMGLEVPDSGDAMEAAIRKHNSRFGVELSQRMAKAIRALSSQQQGEGS